MNERIRELMIEAFQSHYGDPVTPVAREKAVELVSGWGEKFAELIVRECISTLEEKIHRSIDNEGDETWPDLILKEHFGVEE